MKMNFKLHNLACPMCAAAVQNAVSALPGVNKACAHFSNRVLSVEGENLDSKNIIAAIQETGNEVDAELSEDADDPEPPGGPSEPGSSGEPGGAGDSGEPAFASIASAHKTPSKTYLDELCGAECGCHSNKMQNSSLHVGSQHVYQCPEYIEPEELKVTSAWDEQEHCHEHCHTQGSQAHTQAQLLQGQAQSSKSSLLNALPSAGPNAGPNAWLARRLANRFGSWFGNNPHKKEAALLIFSSILFIIAMLWDNFAQAPNLWGVRALFAVPYLLCGWAVFRGAGQAMRSGSIFNEFSLMGLATLAAIAIGEMPEAVGVMLFYRIGEFFQELALNRSRTSIKSLLASRPVHARVLNSNGSIRNRPVQRVLPGETIIVRPGEKVPLDAEIIEGESQFNTAPITGEPKPQTAKPGGKALAGYINLGGMLTLKVSSAFKDSQIARILELVEKAAARKAAPERFVTRFAKVYTPIIIGMAVMVACLPPLLGGGNWDEWIYKSLVLLVISCPCALVISIPLTYFSGIGGASRRGILVKGGMVFDSLKEINTVIFDKTGTLTQGVFEVVQLDPAPGVSEQALLQAAEIAESHSNHPVALSIMRYLKEINGASAIEASANHFNHNSQEKLEIKEVPGQGVIAQQGQNRYLAGNAALLQGNNVSLAQSDGQSSGHSNGQNTGQAQGTLVHIAKNNQYLGSILVSDRLRPESSQTIAQLKERKLKTLMLTGDQDQGASWVAKAIGIDDYRFGLLPTQKVDALEEMANPKTSAFVGDGLNDAPILAMSGIGIAMGGLGSAVAVEASDAVILNDSPAKVVELFDLGKKVRSVVWQNIIMAIGIKIMFITLGIAGLSGLWEAVFADVGVALLAVLNATRAVKI